VLSVDEPRDESVGAFAGTEPVDVEPAVGGLDETVVLAFTSGTTGDPKAVRLTRRNFLASATASAFRLGIDPDDRWCCPLSLYHVGGLSVVVRSVLYGTTAVLTRSRGFDATDVLDVLNGYDCTGVSVVPTMLGRLLEAGDLPESLRFVLVGGAPTPNDIVEACEDRGVPIYPSYGMTEATSQIATARPREAFDDPDTVGRPLLPTDMTVVDDESGEPLPAGEIGE
ncbi:AMP-binding protein, partial [Natrinema soli]